MTRSTPHPSSFYAYDWTRLDDLDLNGTFGKYYAGTEGGIPGIYGLPDRPSSQSTIKFQWVPPNDATG